VKFIKGEIAQEESNCSIKTQGGSLDI